MDRLILVSSKATLEASYNHSTVYKHEKIFNGFPGNQFPLITGNTLPFQKMLWGYYHPRLKRSYLTVSTKNIIHDKRFQISIRNQKCLIPLNCYSIVFKGRRFLIFHESEKLFTVAGIYTDFTDSDQVKHRSFGILTIPASPFLQALGQYEEPLMLKRRDQIGWLAKDLSFATSLMNSNNIANFNALPISSLMDDISQNTKEVLAPIGGRLTSAQKDSIDNLFVTSVYGKKRKKVEQSMTMEERAKQEKKSI